MKFLPLAFLSTLLFVSAAYPQAAPVSATAHPSINPAKEADIRHLLDLTKAGTLAVQAMDGQEKVIRPLVTNSLPPGEYREKLVDAFFAKFHEKRNVGELVDLIIPTYDKYYTREEVQQLIKIYETPLGQKMVESMPKIMQESQEAGRIWGEQLGRNSMREVLEEHPEFKKAIEEASHAAHP